METYGVYKLVFGGDPQSFTFFDDAGLLPHAPGIWKTLNGSMIELIDSSNSGLLEVQWVSDFDASFVDLNGIKHTFRSDVQFDIIETRETYTNTYSSKKRVNKQIGIVDTTVPCAIAHVAVFTPDIKTSCKLFEKVGFIVSDSIDGKCIFMRSKLENPHHQILLAQSVDKTGLQHAAFAVNDIYTVITKGMHIAAKGWPTLLGPGRHVISSSTHWYFSTQVGAFEIAADEDYLTSEWGPTEYSPENSTVYEWAIEGGIDLHTRRQLGVQPPTKFIDQRMK